MSKIANIGEENPGTVKEDIVVTMEVGDPVMAGIDLSDLHQLESERNLM
jgi:hypothetical protein